MFRSRRALAVALFGFVLLAIVASLVFGPGPLSTRVERSVAWLVLGVLCFAAGYLILYVQVRNLFAPKRLVAQFCVIGFWFFACSSVLGWVWLVRSLATDEGAPFGIVGPAAMGLGILQVWLNHFTHSIPRVDGVG